MIIGRGSVVNEWHWGRLTVRIERVHRLGSPAKWLLFGLFSFPRVQGLTRYMQPRGRPKHGIIIASGPVASLLLTVLLGVLALVSAQILVLTPDAAHITRSEAWRWLDLYPWPFLLSISTLCALITSLGSLNPCFPRRPITHHSDGFHLRRMFFPSLSTDAQQLITAMARQCAIDQQNLITERHMWLALLDQEALCRHLASRQINPDQFRASLREHEVPLEGAASTQLSIPLKNLLSSAQNIAWSQRQITVRAVDLACALLTADLPPLASILEGTGLTQEACQTLISDLQRAASI